MAKATLSKEEVKKSERWLSNFLKENKVVHVYVRKGKRPIFVKDKDVRVGKAKPIGVIAGYIGKDGEIRIGWSLCRRDDCFYSKYGIQTALSRATLHHNPHTPEGKETWSKMPHDVRRKMTKAYPNMLRDLLLP